MVGRTLTELRARIERLAADDGPYEVVCGRTAERIVPVDGHRFPDREAAANAAEIAEQYRATLRRYDPRVPCYDPVVCEAPALERSPAPSASKDWAFPPTATHSEASSGRIEFCHRVAGALFEALSNHGHDDVERTVMDAYFDAAETTPSRDRLCSRLLEQMAAELDARLSDAEQAAVLADATTHLPDESTADPSLATAFDRLAANDLIGEYALSPWRVDFDDDERRCRVSVTDYALAPVETHLPTLPITVTMLRHHSGRSLTVAEVTRVGDDTFELTLAAAAEPAGLTTAPITNHAE
ncbi:uncharacterized protein HHUB_4317 (plasmid) [Halobacterium hubeiense]|uniref:Uncharacterized protein n=1 Tax=Halobacterium hubeiense TaxID=1407499 RepID=A0A0U5D219_9EURY|nr:hypothetical protein [Halobacterium hubeiense]CQH64207.1 uncharacterized protein HHUB_4317 [Halobacterium hubeiense]